MSVIPRIGTWRRLGIGLTVLFCLTALDLPASEPGGAEEQTTARDEQSRLRTSRVIHGRQSAPVTPLLFTGDVRDLPSPEPWEPGDPVREIPQRWFPPAANDAGPQLLREDLLPRDALTALQLQRASPDRAVDGSFVAPTRNFPGIPFTGGTPPDTVGDVGPSHFVQAVNRYDGPQIRIWDKATPTPNLLADFELESLAGACDGIGDPIVIYDRQADRWLLAQYNGLCVGISLSGDPVSGGWAFYHFSPLADTDYPKYGVWATDVDGGSGSYVVTVNNDAGNLVFALDRAAMLAGQAATYQGFAVSTLPGFGIQAAAPAQTDSLLGPPAGSPAVVMQHRDTEVHGGPAAPEDLLDLWLLDVSWDMPATSTVTLQEVETPEFDSTICGLTTFDCIPQKDTSVRLAPLREPVMNRLIYMNHGEHESLAGSYTVDADGTDHAGVRWVELRREDEGAWELRQAGTYAIDADHRWMPAIGMDREGNIALGYNVSSVSRWPGLRYTGRQWFDPPGVMSQPETTIIDGAGSSPINRYGDYAAMALDPSDGCTFWFTGEHNPTAEWATQVATFRFASCLCDDEPEAPAPAAAAVGANVVQVSWIDVATPQVEEYLVQRSRTPGGPYETIAVVADSSPGSGGGPGYFCDDTDVSGGTTYAYVVVARAGECRSAPLDEAQATATGDCTLPPAYGGLEQAVSADYDACRVDLSWSDATAECAGPVAFNVYRSTTPGFAPGPATLLASGIAGTSFTDVTGLEHGVEYAYVVRAVDLSNGNDDGNLVEHRVTAAGTATGSRTVLDSFFSSGAEFTAWTVTTGPGLHNCGEWRLASVPDEAPPEGIIFYAQARSLDCGPDPWTSASLTSPSMDTSAPGLQSATLTVSVNYAYGDGGDAAQVEAWDGLKWWPLWTAPPADFVGNLSLDATTRAANNPDFHVRFNYQYAYDDGWFSVDDVRVRTVNEIVCETVEGPPPAPDGAGATTPLTVDRVDPAGTELALAWDVASCPATEYTLLWGDLADVASWTPAGAVCGLVSGSHDWNAAPPGNLFLLVVGTDGAMTEGSWGEATTGERNGSVPSGYCSTAAKIVGTECTPP